MPRRVTTAALRVVTASTGATSDRELLARFVGGDESAFAAVVRRHGAMVQGVCRRVLVHVQDAEDATQAVFLILAKKAKAARWQHSIANWLYGTARRVALKPHRTNSRRLKREAKAVPPTVPASALDGMTGREAFAVLDDELDRLPAIDRESLVLCCLQGLARDEAAERLGVPPATRKSYLDRRAEAAGRPGEAEHSRRGSGARRGCGGPCHRLPGRPGRIRSGRRQRASVAGRSRPCMSRREHVDEADAGRRDANRRGVAWFGRTLPRRRPPAPTRNPR